MSAEDAVAARPHSEFRDRWLSATHHPSFALASMELQFVELCSRGPPEDEELCAVIERDLPRTFPKSPLFVEGGETLDKLRRVLHAYAVMDPEVGYVQGMNFLVGFMLHFFDRESEVFTMLVRLMRHPLYHMRSFFMIGLPEIETLRHVVTHLLERHLPQVSHHFKEVGCDPMFFYEWHFTLYTYTLPLEVVAGIWSEFFDVGWVAMFRVMVVLLEEIKDALVGQDLNGTIRALKSFQAYRVQREYPELGEVEVPVPSSSSTPSSSPLYPHMLSSVQQAVTDAVGSAYASVSRYWWPEDAVQAEEEEEEEWCTLAFTAQAPPDLLPRSRAVRITAEEVEALRKEAVPVVVTPPE